MNFQFWFDLVQGRLRFASLEGEVYTHNHTSFVNETMYLEAFTLQQYLIYLEELKLMLKYVS